MLRTLLVDDEELARREMSSMLSGERDISIVGQASNGLEAVEMITQLKPDLVFLDIEMPGLNGFEVVSSLSYLPTIVFVTAYDQYAIRAFEVNALDYLLKPVSADRVRVSMERAQARREGINSQAPLLQQLMAELQQRRSNYITRLAAYKGRRVLLVNLRDIIYIRVENKLVFIYTETDHFLIAKTISELEELLCDKGFFQVNRSAIINVDHLVEVIPWFSGTCRLKLTKGIELQLSRERVPLLKAAIGLCRRYSGK